MRYFRFRSGSHFGSKKGFLRQFLGVFGSQTSRTSRGTKKRPIRGRVWRRLGLYIYTQQREQRGATSGQKRGVSAPKQAGRPGEGRKTRGRPLRAAYATVPRCSIWYGANDLIKVPRLSNIPHHIFGTTHTVPHIWYLTIEGTFKIERYSNIISNIHIKIRPLV